MNFTITLDPRAILGELDAMRTKQLPEATRNALNWTAAKGVASIQGRMRGILHLRRENWVVGSIRIVKYANKADWNVIIAVAPKFQDIAERMETGHDHVPKWGNHFCIPNKDVFKRAVITTANELHPLNLHFVKKGKAMEGDKRTFLVISPKGVPLILQRTSALKAKRSKGNLAHGAAKTGTRILYTLVTRSKVPAKLRFYQTIQEAVSANWATQMNEAMDTAMRSAR